MTKPLPESMRQHFDALAAHFGAYDPNAGTPARRVSELLKDLLLSAERAVECGSRFALVAVTPEDIPAIKGAQQCVAWAESAIKSRKHQEG